MEKGKWPRLLKQKQKVKCTFKNLLLVKNRFFIKSCFPFQLGFQTLDTSGCHTCTGVSHVRALSPAWTGSPARETLISRTHLFLPHDLPPTKKIKYNKILTYILRSIFLEIPHLELTH